MAEQFLQKVAQAYSQYDSQRISRLFHPLNPTPGTLSLRKALQRVPNLRTGSYVQTASSLIQDNKPFAEFLGAYLTLTRNASFEVAQDVEVAERDYDLMKACFAPAVSVFQQPDGGWFAETINKFAHPFVSLAFQVDGLLGKEHGSKTQDTISYLNRVMTVASNTRGQDFALKRKAALRSANELFRIYFKIDNLLVCENVARQAQNVAPFLDTGEYFKSDLVTFYFYTGRIDLSQRHIRRAMNELSKAFELCTERQWKNRQAILIYLIPCRLICGYTPCLELLDHYQFSDQYYKLIQALKRGDFATCLEELDRWRSWHIRKHTYLLLREKLETICWRNLARQCHLVCSKDDPRLSIERSTKMTLQELTCVARILMDDPTLEDTDVECMMLSLIDQGYIKGYMWHSSFSLILKKGAEFGFPPVSSVNPQRS